MHQFILKSKQKARETNAAKRFYGSWTNASMMDTHHRPKMRHLLLHCCAPTCAAWGGSSSLAPSILRWFPFRLSKTLPFDHMGKRSAQGSGQAMRSSDWMPLATLLVALCPKKRSGVEKWVEALIFDSKFAMDAFFASKSWLS
jgi:hypothetical protein